MSRVVVPLLDGFEEIEAVTIIDVLRRAEIDVTVAGESPGSVRGSHDIEVIADAAIADVAVDRVEMIVLPGGMPGATNLANHAGVCRLVKQLAAAGKYTCAICAGPIALAAAGVIAGKRVTCYPGFESHLEAGKFVQDRVVVDGKLVTSRGPGTAMEFALTLVKLLAGVSADRALAERMLVRAAS
jgi:4-methyl-5(b-hydroxyethyl)-thiazole monophosphate biosynthesis